MAEYRGGALLTLSKRYSARVFVVNELREVRLLLLMLHQEKTKGRIIICLGKNLHFLRAIINHLSFREVAFIGEDICEVKELVFLSPYSFNVCLKHTIPYIMLNLGLRRDVVARNLSINVKQLYSIENYMKRRVGAVNRLVLYAFSDIILHIIQENGSSDFS